MTTSHEIQLKRVYEPAEASDGTRILVERLWPRGLSKDKAHVEYWCKEIAPSTELRQWYGHEVDRWPDFRKKYLAELEENPDAVSELREHCRDGKKITFVYAAHDEEHNSAVVLKEFMGRTARAGAR